MSIKGDTSLGAPVATVVYQNTCYPAHQVSVNGKVVYSYVPDDDTTGYIVGCLLAGLGDPGTIGPLIVPSGQ